MVELRDCMHMQVSMAVNGSDVSIKKFSHLKSFSNLCGLCPVFITEYYFLSLFISRTQFCVNPCSTFFVFGGFICEQSLRLIFGIQRTTCCVDVSISVNKFSTFSCLKGLFPRVYEVSSLVSKTQKE